MVTDASRLTWFAGLVKPFSSVVPIVFSDLCKTLLTVTHIAFVVVNLLCCLLHLVEF